MVTDIVNVSENHRDDHPNTGPCPACSKTSVMGRCTWRDEFGVVHHFCSPACRARFSRAPSCPKCKKRGVALKVAVGRLQREGQRDLLVPVGGALCDPCFEARGIPEHVLLTKCDIPIETVS